MWPPRSGLPEKRPKFVLSQPSEPMVQSSFATWKIFAAAWSDMGEYLISRGLIT